MKIFKTIVKVFETTSTMDLAKTLSKKFPLPLVVQSVIQTKGRGRYGREWLSNEGGLWITEVFDIQRKLGLSTFFSIPLLNVLSKYTQGINVRWPNDILVNGRKISGILIEITDFTYVGIGVNVNNEIDPSLKNSSISLKDLSRVDEAYIMNELLEEEENLLPVFIDKGFKIFRDEYERHLLFLNEVIKVDKGDILEGKLVGVGDLGQLLLSTNSGLKEIFSGSILD